MELMELQRMIFYSEFEVKSVGLIQRSDRRRSSLNRAEQRLGLCAALTG